MRDVRLHSVRPDCIPGPLMAHTCPTCDSACYCDGEDTFIEADDFECQHECDVEDFDDDGFECLVCDDRGCNNCIPDYQCCAAYPDCLHRNPNRGDRKAVSEALVAPLFDTEKK